jgi:hypothetical protein
MEKKNTRVRFTNILILLSIVTLLERRTVPVEFVESQCRNTLREKTKLEIQLLLSFFLKWTTKIKARERMAVSNAQFISVVPCLPDEKDKQKF